MEEIELNDDDWASLNRKLVHGNEEDALKSYTPPVKLTHDREYVLYEIGGEDERSYE